METINLNQARDQLAINEFDLQTEWSMQPILFLDYSIILSKLINDRDTMKSHKTEEIIKNAQGSKVSEAYLSRELDNDQELIDYQTQISNAKAIVSAFGQRKCALENSVTLLINGMNAEPKTPEEKEAVKNYIKKGVKEQRNAENKGS